MDTQKKVRGTGAVEYALLLLAVTIGGAAATKAVGHAVAHAGDQAAVELGGSGSGGGSGTSSGVGGVKQLPNTGAGPCKGDECKAADTNGDGVVTEEEWNAYLLKKQEELQNQQQTLSQLSNIEKQKHSLLQSIINNIK